MSLRVFSGVFAASFALLGLAARAGAELPEYTLFEAGQVRPLAISPDGTRLFALNTPNAQLEIYAVDGSGLTFVEAVPVGLEPVAVAARDDAEVWVVNHLSDSISVVDVALDPARVVRTLLVGDEPRDIVFAGSGGNRAFITTAHRGQNSPYPQGEYDLEGTGRADVWVFDAAALGTSLGGDPLTIVTLFGDRPRALAASTDGSTVFAAVFRSGNQTMALGEPLVCDSDAPCSVEGVSYPGGLPSPKTNFDGTQSREAGLIVGWNESSELWEDELGRDWSNGVRFTLPDTDVFGIDADATTPVEIGSASGVGTILFNMLVNPANGHLYITNTEAINRVRFEGLGDWVDELGPKPSGDPATVRGHLHEARVTVIDAALNVLPRHLNKHIDYSARPQPAGTKERSLSTPLEMAISGDGSTLYVAGFGSAALGVYDTAALEADTFTPDAANMISLPRGGPSGLVLDEARDRLYVMTRFENSIVVLDTETRGVVQTIDMENPEPGSVIDGRPFLYDAQLTGSNGEASCASCHVFGDMDDLAWDLGDPDLLPAGNPNPCPPGVVGVCNLQDFDPLKGPMTTQSLRGLHNAGPMHWRGDRTGANDGGEALDTNAAFNLFNVAFPGLVGRDQGELDPEDMQAFTDFALQITYPPNPIRQLDNSLRPNEQAGLDLYNGRITDTVANCNGCHVLDPESGFFGTSGGSTFEGETMEFKVPHLRNAYQKVGMFGMAPSPFFIGADTAFAGDQVRGSGFLHDGSVPRMTDFLSANVFNDVSSTDRQNLEALVMAFDSNLAPIVGQQVTLRQESEADTDARVDLLIERAGTPFAIAEEAAATECDLLVTGVVDDQAQRWLRRSDGSFESLEGGISETDLLALADVLGQSLTFTCTSPGSGARMAGVDPEAMGGTGGDGGEGGSGGSAGSGGLNTENGKGGCGCVVGASPREGLSGAAVAALTLLGLATMQRRRRRY
ncbi:MAG: MYXO-CTERM sorting domain-containing protein [Polyangiales bacterium]